MQGRHGAWSASAEDRSERRGLGQRLGSRLVKRQVLGGVGLVRMVSVRLPG